MKRGFTLTELMIVIAIMAILAGLGLSAMASATNMAREHRTEAQIKKIDLLVMEKWEGYRTRSVPVKLPVGVDPRTSANLRLTGLRDLQRMEIPDRVTDVVDGPANLSFNFPLIQPPVRLSAPSIWKKYRANAARFAGANWATTWTTQYEGAECLYLILSTLRDGDKAALDCFDASEVGDVDNDGMPEVLDGWGQPIMFLRWAPGYVSTVAVPLATPQEANWNIAPDYFDHAKADLRFNPNFPQFFAMTPKPYALFPLIVSGGPDKQLDIAMKLSDPLVGGQFHYVNTALICDPYFVPTNSEKPAGTPVDENNDGPNWQDNITNHAMR